MDVAGCSRHDTFSRCDGNAIATRMAGVHNMTAREREPAQAPHTMLSALALPSKLSQPARRALANAGYTRLDQPAGLREADIARLHGVGPNALAQLRQALAANGLSFATDERKHG